MTFTEGSIYGLMAVTAYAWIRFNHATLDDAFSPFNLLLFFWVLPYLGSLLKLSAFQHGLTLEAHVLVASATLSMVLPSLAAAYLLYRTRLAPSLAGFTISPLRYPAGYALVILFLALTVFAYWQATFAGRGIPLVEYAAGGVGGGSLHQAGMKSRLQILAHAIPLAGAIVLYLALTTRPGLKRLALFALAAVPPVLGILRAFKSDVFGSVVAYAVVVYYYRRSRNLRLPPLKLALAAILFVGVLGLLTTLRTTGMDNPALYSRLIDFKYKGLPFPLNETLGVVYGYSSLTFENFGRFLEYGGDGTRLGTSMFRPLYSVFMQGRIPDSMLAGINWHPVGGFANAPNALTDLYVEGGPLLCILGPLAYGALVNFVYVRFRRSGSPTWLFLYVNFALPWVWMFFSNAFSVLGYYVQVFYVVALATSAAWIHHLIQSVPSRHEPSRATLDSAASAVV